MGTAGVDGFDDGRCQEIFFYKGGHSRPLDKDALPGLVDCLLDGQILEGPSDKVDEIGTILATVGRLAPSLAIVVVLLALCIVPGVWRIYVTYGLIRALTVALLVVVVAVCLDAY